MLHCNIRCCIAQVDNRMESIRARRMRSIEETATQKKAKAETPDETSLY